MIPRAVPLILLLLPLVGLLAGCERSAAAAPVPSPDGTLTLTTAVNQSKADSRRYLCVIVEIRDRAGTLLYHEVTPASATQRWAVRWASSGEVVLDSSDIGPYVIRRKPDGTWQGGVGR